MRWRVLTVTLLALAVRLHHLLGTSEPTGWDGYSYVVQIERLVSEGRLHWPDASWVTYFLAALHLLVPSAVLAVKLGVCALAALVVPAAWRFGGWPLALWAAASPTLTHLAGDFGKSLAVVAPLLLLPTLALPSRERLLSRGTIFLLVALVAATAHKLGATLLLLGGLGAFLGARTTNTSARSVVLIGLISLLAFSLLTVLLPNLLHPADLDRVSGQLSFSLHVPSPWPYFALRGTSWWERLELLAAWPALAFGAWRFVVRRDERVRLGMVLLPLVVCVLPVWRTDVLDLGYRLALMTPAFSFALLLPVPRGQGAPRWALMLVPLVLVARAGFDVADQPPYAQWRALIARIPRPLPVLLIAPQGFNFLYDHETGHEALAWSPEPGIDRATTWRLAWGVRDGEWAELAAGLEPRPVRLSADVVYLREDVWEQFVARVKADGDDDLLTRLSSPRNPSRVRPASLTRNH